MATPFLPAPMGSFIRGFSRTDRIGGNSRYDFLRSFLVQNRFCALDRRHLLANFSMLFDEIRGALHLFGLHCRARCAFAGRLLYQHGDWHRTQIRDNHRFYHSTGFCQPSIETAPLGSDVAAALASKRRQVPRASGKRRPIEFRKTHRNSSTILRRIDRVTAAQFKPSFALGISSSVHRFRGNSNHRRSRRDLRSNIANHLFTSETSVQLQPNSRENSLTNPGNQPMWNLFALQN